MLSSFFNEKKDVYDLLITMFIYNSILNNRILQQHIRDYLNLIPFQIFFFKKKRKVNSTIILIYLLSKKLISTINVVKFMLNSNTNCNFILNMTSKIIQ